MRAFTHLKQVITLNISIVRLARSFTMSVTQRKAFEHLPSSVVPVNYTLHLHPDLEKFTFVGKESIDVEVTYYCKVDISVCRFNKLHRLTYRRAFVAHCSHAYC